MRWRQVRHLRRLWWGVEGRASTTRHGLNIAAGCHHFANYGADRVSNKDIFQAVDKYASGIVQFRIQWGAAITGIGQEVISDDGANRARCHLANHRVVRIYDKNVS